MFKPNFHHKKILPTLFGTAKEIIHFKLLNIGQTHGRDLLFRVIMNLRKTPGEATFLINRKGSLLLPDGRFSYYRLCDGQLQS